MATNFPTSLDSFTNPTSTDTLASPDHAGQHTNVNDAVAALEAKVGVNGSAVTTTLDYKVGKWFRTVLADTTSTYTYMGVAKYGSSQTSAVWTVTRITTSTPITTTVATPIKWSDRYTATYV